MKIFDVHIHAFNTGITPKKLISDMDAAGIYGGCVFSNLPDRTNPKTGTNFESRLEEVLSWCRGYENRLFPIMYIHPYEDDIINKIHRAVDSGIVGFKMICTDYFVYEEDCLRVLREIASLNKPVFFHTGILWDGEVSSKYNRPLNWEDLLEIEGLRFSMGHCSWPWIDECVALYGKFMSAKNTKKTSELFFDITPGTPPQDRERLLERIYTLGYDSGDNVMFGADCIANVYNSDYVKEWLDRDRNILDRLGVSRKNREKLYYKNLLRFLGKADFEVEQELPDPEKPTLWRCDNPEVYKTIEEYYKLLKFPKVFDNAFYKAISTVKISDDITIDRYNKSCDDGIRNLLSFLYMCKNTRENYEKLGIPDSVLINTLKDIVIYTNIWSDIKGSLYLGELHWLSLHLSARLFRLGRLQFGFGKSPYDIPKLGINKGDDVIDIHIPEGEPLTISECEKSINEAKAFFKKYFPNFKYKYFTCHSWLLDDTLDRFLPETSNIIKFKAMFTRYFPEESSDILRYVFRWNTNETNLRFAYPVSSFAEKVKKYLLSGKSFKVAYGILK